MPSVKLIWWKMLLGSTCMFWSCNYVWREKVKINSMEFLHLSKLVPLELQYVRRRGWASASITSWKLSNKLLMDTLTIYYWYSIRRLTWDIKKIEKKYFLNLQPYLAIQWSSIHDIIEGPTRMEQEKWCRLCKLWCEEILMSRTVQVSISKV